MKELWCYNTWHNGLTRGRLNLWRYVNLKITMWLVFDGAFCVGQSHICGLWQEFQVSILCGHFVSIVGMCSPAVEMMLTVLDGTVSLSVKFWTDSGNLNNAFLLNEQLAITSQYLGRKTKSAFNCWCQVMENVMSRTQKNKTGDVMAVALKLDGMWMGDRKV